MPRPRNHPRLTIVWRTVLYIYWPFPCRLLNSIQLIFQMLAHHGHTGQVLFVLLFGQLVTAFTISIQTTVPSNATALSPSLLSFSIEQDRWTDWVGTTSRNNFFFNTLDNLKQLTGEPPQIRIGANSEDHTNCDDSVQVGDISSNACFHTYPQNSVFRRRFSGTIDHCTISRS